MGDTSNPGAAYCEICGCKTENSFAISVGDAIPEPFLGYYDSQRSGGSSEGNSDSVASPAVHVKLEAGQVRIFEHADAGEDQT